MLLIGNLDSDHGLARHRCLNANSVCTHDSGQIVGKSHNAIYLDPRSRLDFVTSDHRTGTHLHHLTPDIEVAQSIFEKASIVQQRVFVDPALCIGGFIQ